MKYKLSASILSADFAKLGQEINDLTSAGIDYIHFDVMDNHYVPNLSFGPMLCSSIHKCAPHAVLDVHIMASPVDRLISEFANANAHCITIHPDATTHLDKSLTLIKQAGCLAGIALNPATPIDSLKYILHKIDRILVMSVNPGFGGQSFIEESIQKIKDIVTLTKSANIHIPIAVDGGININNIATIKNAGAEIFILGTSLLKTNNYKQTITQMHTKLKQ